MALARSASGPGGLSINTGSANLFGSSTTPSQPAQGGGLFGQSTTQTPSTSTTAGGLFGGAAAAKPAAGLFGGTTATSQPQQSGGFFGSTQPATSQPQQQTSSLFGGASAQPTQQQQQQPQAGGGLFGASAQAAKPSLFMGAAASTPTSQPQQTGGGLFGGSTMAQPQQTSSLFGGGQQQKPAGSSLFGGGAAQQTQQTQQTQGSSLFGQPQQTSSILGGQQQQPQQSVPGVRIDVSQVKGSTKFDDLTKELQDQISGIEAILLKVAKWKDEIAGYTPVHEQEIKSLAVDVAYLQNKYELVRRAVLEGDVAAIQELRSLSNKNQDDAQTVGRAVENLKLPAHYHLPGLWTSTGGANTSFAGGDPNETDLIGFFNRQCTQLEERDKKLRGYLNEIQQHMPNVEGGLYQKLTALQGHMGASYTAFEEMKATLVDMRDVIVRQAVEVGKCREALTKLQMTFLNPL